METLLSSVIFITIMVPLHRGRFVVVHLYSTFSIEPQNFPLGENLYQKLPFFTVLGAASSHFSNHKREIWHEGADLGLSPQAKFCRNSLRGYTPLGQIHMKNYQFCRFRGL